MKIAVLLFGQPRFWDITKELILEEFDLPGHEVHFYAHFWKNIGYTPAGEEENYDTEAMYTSLRQAPQFSFNKSFKNIVIEDYTKLYEVCDHMSYFSTQLHNRPMVIGGKGKQDKWLVYKFGQHVSIRQGFKKIIQYEKQENFKYDIIIKTRTDIVYKPKVVYSTGQEYYEAKDKYYTDLKFDIPSIRCTALRFVDSTNKSKDFNCTNENVHVRSFYNNQFKIENSDTWLEYPDTNYYNRICYNDWTLISNRAAAEIILFNWFENYFLTLSKDIKNNKTTRLLISESEHAIQGQFLINNPIYANRVYKRRDIRLLHPTNIKDNVDLYGKILAENTGQIRKDLVKRFKGTNR